jgi:hypothetical protein
VYLLVYRQLMQEVLQVLPLDHLAGELVVLCL